MQLAYVSQILKLTDSQAPKGPRELGRGRKPPGICMLGFKPQRGDSSCYVASYFAE